MATNFIASRIRAKKLGVLIKDARLYNEKSREDCARLIRVTQDQFSDFEFGVESPSLPQLELLAQYLDVPLDHFWGSQTLSNGRSHFPTFDVEKLMSLRHRIIGTLIRKARKDADQSLQELAEKIGLSAELLNQYELGELPIPLPTLELIAEHLDQPIKVFHDKDGPLGELAIKQQQLNEFDELPPNLQEFISKPINRPYLELAQRLSEMSVEKLRMIAEGLLEITL
jgi:transcriptional regulator with XRE-family HTH domain